jgi:hypothetical protein
MDVDLTKKVRVALEQHGVKYVVFGAVALAFARFTSESKRTPRAERASGGRA